MAFVANEYKLGDIGFEVTFLAWDFVELPNEKAEQYHFCQMQEKNKIKNEHFHSKKTWTHFIIGRYGSAENILIVDYSSFVATTWRKLYLLPSWIGC